MNDGKVSPLVVGVGQSSRLQKMHKQAMAASQVSPNRESTQIGVGQQDKDLAPELLIARQLIDNRLAEILAMLPVGKQKRLFKIRFGIELDWIKRLPIKRVMALLEISHPDLLPSSPAMKRVGVLNYEGEVAD